MAIEQSISPFLTDALDLEETIASLERKPNRKIPDVHDLDRASNEGNLDLENLIQIK